MTNITFDFLILDLRSKVSKLYYIENIKRFVFDILKNGNL
jgi:hypothetical protein